MRRGSLEGQSEQKDEKHLIELSMVEVESLMKSKQALLKPWTGTMPVEKL